MSIGHKSSNTQMFRLTLYRRALHPELFELNARRTDRHGDYEVETWLAQAGHVVRFTVAGQCLTEAVLEQSDHLPENGLIHALPCIGEKDYDLEPTGDIGYVTTIQTETLTDNLYTATYREMLDFADEAGAMVHRFGDEHGGTPSLSVIDVQKYKAEFHLQTYHLVGTTGLVLRTQSIFEVL